MKARIRQWFLDDCPYARGVALYTEIGRPYNPAIFTDYLLANYVPADIRQKLEYALTTHYQSLPDQSPTPVKRTEPNTNTKSAGNEIPNKSLTKSSNRSDEPLVISHLRKKAKTQHKLHTLAFFKLQTATTDEERYEHARNIMVDIIPTIDSLYERIRHYEDTGEIPPKDATNDIVRDTVQKMQKVNTLTSRISKIKRLIKGNLPANKKQSYEKELLEKEVLLAELRHGLNLD